MGETKLRRAGEFFLFKSTTEIQFQGEKTYHVLMLCETIEFKRNPNDSGNLNDRWQPVLGVPTLPPPLPFPPWEQLSEH